ncbi:MAG: cystathionine beta-synthase [Chloroflexi bacterium]|nr:cystathionine beta-synthase [Chloroflexota bacterium]
MSDQNRVYNNILQTIGRTPLIHLGRIGRELPASLYAKVEYFNPGGSIKDRIAVNIIEDAEHAGRLKPGGTVVESTSGNTGMGLALVCAQKGYKAVFVMPDKMSQEKIQLLSAHGARVVITPTAVEPDDPRSYYNVAKRIAAETPNAILANQYHNPENPRSHYLSTGPEIWEQTEGKITDLVACMGTGGTISGTACYLKEKNPNIRIVGVDPLGSILLETWKNGGRIPEGAKASPYKVEGFGEDFLPSTLNLSLIDEVVRINDKESFLWARRLVKEEGIFSGGSAGAALAAAVRYAQSLRIENADQGSERLIVVILPDSGSRYLSKLYDDKWMRENGYLEPEWSGTQLGEILDAKSSSRLITTWVTDRMTDVIASLKEHDVSQMPALYSDGTLAGLVTEVDLLNHMLENGYEHSPDETIESVIRPAETLFPSSTRLDDALPALVSEQAVLVTEDDHPLGILTKIDILDFIAQKI